MNPCKSCCGNRHDLQGSFCKVFFCYGYLRRFMLSWVKVNIMRDRFLQGVMLMHPFVMRL